LRSKADVVRKQVPIRLLWVSVLMGLCFFATSSRVSAQAPLPSETTQDYNKRITELSKDVQTPPSSTQHGDYLIGPEDLLEISVLEAPDFNRVVRVSDDGAVSLALLGSVQAAGLTPRELQRVLEDRLRQTYMKEPQVSVFVQEMKSHPVSVFGAVEKPGVYQIRNAKTLIEILSMAQGLATDAGDSVVVVRHPGDPTNVTYAALIDTRSATSSDAPPTQAASKSGPALLTTSSDSIEEGIHISLKELLDSSDPSTNVMVYPGDTVKVSRAGIVYVVGQVRKPGGFLLKTNENISVLQAIALAEGLAPNAKGSEARIFQPATTGTPKETPINLDKILAGKAPSVFLKPNDVLFVPNSAGKEALHVLEQSTAGIVGAVGGAAIYRW
jgi:polysaccharide biosynthesis/export protein